MAKSLFYKPLAILIIEESYLQRFFHTLYNPLLDFFIFTLCIKAFQLSSSIRQELDLSLMYSIISPIKKDINVPIETNKLSLSPNDSMKIENVNVKLLYI